jgi:hypothetical protein
MWSHNDSMTTAQRGCFAALTLVLSALAVLSTGTTASAATFKERWCSSKPAPCVQSATRNDVTLTASHPDIEIQMVGAEKGPDGKYVAFLIVDTSGELNLSDKYSVTLDLGKLRPDYTEGYASRPDVDRLVDGDGTYRVTYTGRPVLLTSGCNGQSPSVCPKTATGQGTVFSAEVHELKRNRHLTGVDRSQSVDSVDGIFLTQPARGAPYLISEWANSHYQTDGTTVVRGEARFRLPNALLRSHFGIPDPGTVVSRSFIGSINGKRASFSFRQDPDGGGVYVDISGVTFSNKTVKVKRGTIKPTRPNLTKSKRKSAARATVKFLKAKPRGARITAYQVRCKNGRTTKYADAGNQSYRTGITIKGLKRGVRYSCSVRAKSKVGASSWSKTRRV